jgi:23S rRNA (pseudouridine1915-N3)-methyltransferase
MKLRIKSRQYSKNGHRILFLGNRFHSILLFPGAFAYAAPMNLALAYIGARPSPRDPLDALTKAYVERCTPWAQCVTEAFRTEDALFDWLQRKQGRTRAVLVLFDSHGKQMTSEAFAAWLGARRDDGAQHTVFAVGPADGWSEESKARAQLLLSLGPMTMAHSLARLVAAEQLYRAFTILAGHPYHGGH